MIAVESFTWVNYRGPNFHLDIPSTWFVAAAPNVQALFIAPDAGQKFRANLMITLCNVEPDVTAVEVAASAKATQSRDYSGYNVEIEDSVALGTIPGFYRFYDFWDTEHKLHIVQSQTYLVAAGVLFALTASCKALEQETFLPIFDTMISSFQIGLS